MVSPKKVDLIFPSPDLLVLPFKAKLLGTSNYLTFEQLLSLLRGPQRGKVEITRSFPTDRFAIGWTIFLRTTQEYLYENQPLFRFERDARCYIRKAYAIHYSKLESDWDL